MSGLGSRILVAGGIGLMAVGVGGAIWMMPPGQLQGAASWLEDRRTALRSHLPEMPEMNDVLLGTNGAEADTAGAGTSFSSQPVRTLRGGGARTALAAPVATEPCAGSEGTEAQPDDCAASADASEPTSGTGTTLLNRSRTTSTRFRAPGG